MSYKKIREGKYKIEVERQINGRRKRKSKTITSDLKGRDLKRQISNIENELYERLADDTADKYDGILYEDFVNLFISSGEIEDLTIHYYDDYLRRRAMNAFRGMPIANIKRAHVVDFIQSLQKTISPYTKKPLSPKTIKHHRDCLRALFNYAVYLEIVDKNPADHIKVDPVPNKVEGRFFEPEEVDALLGALEEKGDFKYYVFFVLQFYTGCRPSEMYGLTWDKIDFVREQITIDQSLVPRRSSPGYVLKSTKTSDIRIKPLPGSIVVLLKKLKSISLGTTNYVFTNADGDHLAESSFRKYLQSFCKKNNLPYLPPYAIRHTTGTFLAAQGTPMPNIAELLGHTNQQTTAKYIHATQNKSDEANKMLADTIRPRIKIVK